MVQMEQNRNLKFLNIKIAFSHCFTVYESEWQASFCVSTGFLTSACIRSWTYYLYRHQSKRSSYKKFIWKGTLRQVFICLRPPFLQWPLTPPPLHIVYVFTVYLFLHREGGEGGEEMNEPERRLEGQLFTKLGRKYKHDLLYLQSIYSDKHQPQSPFTGQFF